MRPFFTALCAAASPGGDGRGAGKPKTGIRWGDIYGTLIANGHDPARIGDYTERQLMLYYDAALRRERHQRAGKLFDARVAFGADSTGFQGHLKKLQKD